MPSSPLSHLQTRPAHSPVSTRRFLTRAPPAHTDEHALAPVCHCPSTRVPCRTASTAGQGPRLLPRPPLNSGPPAAGPPPASSRRPAGCDSAVAVSAVHTATGPGTVWAALPASQARAARSTLHAPRHMLHAPHTGHFSLQPELTFPPTMRSASQSPAVSVSQSCGLTSQ